MAVIALDDRRRSPRGMPQSIAPEIAERQLLGQALKNLRERKDKTQGEVGTPLGLTAQGWQYYEAGHRRFTDEKVGKALEALGLTLVDLEAEKARILGSRPQDFPGVRDARAEFVFDVFGRSRMNEAGAVTYDVAMPLRRLDLRQLLGRGVDALEIAGDQVSPWGESGEIVLFDRERSPRRGKGCVIEMKNGEAIVRIYEKSDGSTLFAKELFPDEKVVNFSLRDVAGVFPVILRGD